MDTYKTEQPQINLGDQVVYLAGPMTGLKDFNFETFAEKAHHFKEQGWEVINPADLAYTLATVEGCGVAELTTREYAQEDLSHLVARATHMYMLNGWQYSKGAKAEHAVAEWLGITIMYQSEEDRTTAEHHDKEWWFTFQENAFQDIVSLTRKKNNDYTGGADTPNPFANFDEANEFGVDPLVGLSVRMGDKMQRLKSFCNAGLSLETKGDTVADIFKDMIGYSSIALGMLERRKERD
jgi:hypothetical protein